MIPSERGRVDKFLSAIVSVIAILAFFGISRANELQPYLAGIFSKLDFLVAQKPSLTVRKYLNTRFGGEPQKAWSLLGSSARNADWENDYVRFFDAVKRDSLCPWELHELSNVGVEELKADVYVYRTVTSGRGCETKNANAFIYSLIRRDKESPWFISSSKSTKVKEPEKPFVAKLFKDWKFNKKTSSSSEFSPSELLAQMRQLDSDSQKIELLKLALRGIDRDLTFQFVREILSDLDSDSYRLNALKILRPHVVAPTQQDTTSITAIFDSGTYKLEAVKALQ